MDEIQQRQPWRLIQLWRLWRLTRYWRLWRLTQQGRLQLVRPLLGAAAALTIVSVPLWMTWDLNEPVPATVWQIETKPVIKPLPPNPPFCQPN